MHHRPALLILALFTTIITATWFSSPQASAQAGTSSSSRQSPTPPELALTPTPTPSNELPPTQPNAAVPAPAVAPDANFPAENGEAASMLSAVNSVSECTDQRCVFQVAADTDDAGTDYLCRSDTGWNEIYFGRCTNGNPITSGLRFPNIALPRGAEIARAYLEFNLDGPYNVPINVRFWGEATGDAQPFSYEQPTSQQPQPRPEDRTLTQASVRWSVPTNFTWQWETVREGPDITPIVREIINREDWVPFQALSVIIKDDGTPRPDHRRAYAYERPGTSGTKAPRLVVELASAPPYTISYYQNNVSTSIHRYQGCVARQRAERGLVLLVYGSPRYILRDGEIQNVAGRPVMGVGLLPNQEAPASIAEVERAVQGFLDGYYNYRTCASIGVQISDPVDPELLVAVSVSNSAFRLENFQVCDQGVRDSGLRPNLAITEEHGRQWGEMVTRLNQYAQRNGYVRMTVTAGFDAEPSWWQVYELDGDCYRLRPRYQDTLGWVNGYASVPRRPPYVFFGSTDGGFRTSDWIGRSNFQPATQENLNNIISLVRTPEIAAELLPQTYTWQYAQEWYQLKRYARLRKGIIGLDIDGALTGCGAAPSKIPCTFSDPRLWPEFELARGILWPNDYQDLTPRQGWQALYDTLNRTLAPNYTLRTTTNTTGPILVPDGRTITAPTSVNCNRGAVYSARTVINTGECLPAGTIFEKDQTFATAVQTPVGEEFPFDRIAQQRILRWSTDLRYNPYR